MQRRTRPQFVGAFLAAPVAIGQAPGPQRPSTGAEGDGVARPSGRVWRAAAGRGRIGGPSAPPLMQSRPKPVVADAAPGRSCESLTVVGTGGGGVTGGSQAGVIQPAALGFAAGAADTEHEGASGSFAVDANGRLNWSGAVTRSRPLCAYPQVAKYKGNGSTDDASNVACSSAF